MQADEQKIRALPCWNGPVEVAVLKGGMSNANYLVTDAVGKHVVRFGVDYPFHHVFRDRELSGQIAQLVEHSIENAGVPSSTLGLPTTQSRPCGPRP